MGAGQADATSVISTGGAIDHCSGVTNRESKYQSDERGFHFIPFTEMELSTETFSAFLTDGF